MTCCKDFSNPCSQTAFGLSCLIEFSSKQPVCLDNFTASYHRRKVGSRSASEKSGRLSHVLEQFAQVLQIARSNRMIFSGLGLLSMLLSNYRTVPATVDVVKVQSC